MPKPTLVFAALLAMMIRSFVVARRSRTAG
jgi:hypothetical protein